MHRAAGRTSFPTGPTLAMMIAGVPGCSCTSVYQWPVMSMASSPAQGGLP